MLYQFTNSKSFYHFVKDVDGRVSAIVPNTSLRYAHENDVILPGTRLACSFLDQFYRQHMDQCYILSVSGPNTLCGKAPSATISK